MTASDTRREATLDVVAETRRAYGLLLGGIAALALVHIADGLVGRPLWLITRSFNLGADGNVPTWYSSCLLLVAAVTSLWCYRSSVRRGLRPRLGWLAFAALLAALSCDETALIHERLGVTLSNRLLPRLAAEWSHTSWPLILGPVAFVVAFAFAWTLKRHLAGSRRAAWFLTVGAATLLGSGIVLESSINWLNRDGLKWLWEIEVVAEETGEMLGAWLIGYGLLLHGMRLASGKPGPLDEPSGPGAGLRRTS